jgi:putative heme iron utilization protein
MSNPDVNELALSSVSTLLKIRIAAAEVDAAEQKVSAAVAERSLAQIKHTVASFCSRKGIPFTGIHPDGLLHILEATFEKGGGA